MAYLPHQSHRSTDPHLHATSPWVPSADDVIDVSAVAFGEPQSWNDESFGAQQCDVIDWCASLQRTSRDTRTVQDIGEAIPIRHPTGRGPPTPPDRLTGPAVFASSIVAAALDPCDERPCQTTGRGGDARDLRHTSAETRPLGLSGARLCGDSHGGRNTGEAQCADCSLNRSGQRRSRRRDPATRRASPSIRTARRLIDAQGKPHPTAALNGLPRRSRLQENSHSRTRQLLPRRWVIIIAI